MARLSALHRTRRTSKRGRGADFLPPQRRHEGANLRRARAATSDEAKKLQLPPGEPGVELHRTTYTAAGTVVEFAIGVHAASRFAWEYDFKVPDSAKDKEDRQ
jgi:hypothetical protein